MLTSNSLEMSMGRHTPRNGLLPVVLLLKERLREPVVILHRLNGQGSKYTNKRTKSITISLEANKASVARLRGGSSRVKVFN